MGESRPETRPAAEWTCATCGASYPADFAVCPRDATPRADAAAPAGDPLIGVVLGRTYRIARVIGEGGMARLYAAEHLRVERRFAVKVIHDDLAKEPELLARFEREARAAGRISSRHVVGVIDVLRTDDGRPCIVSELLEGEDLAAHLERNGKMTAAEAIPIARQVLSALAAAHACGVVHRDLKPSNVFLCRGGDEPLVKVLDFGVAKVADDDQLTRTDALVGTPAYMAPEQARRASDAGPQADIYTVGALLYHMLTGEPPYGKAPASSRLALLLYEEPPRPRELEPAIALGVEAVVQHAMARDPAARPSAAELEAELAAFDAPAAQPSPALSPAPPIAADQIALKARLARPAAAAAAIAASLGAGLWASALLAEVVGAPGARTWGERVLITLFALAASAAVGLIEARTLYSRWRSATAIGRHAAMVAQALFAGVTALGALELFARGAATVFNLSPGWGVLRVGLSGLAACLVLLWHQLDGSKRLRALLP